MIQQPSLFGVPDTVPSPICVSDGKCPRQGRAQLGPVEQVRAGCWNRSVLCLTCQRTGVQSTNSEPKVKAS